MINIEELYRKIATKRHKLLRYKLGFSYEDADDILQDAFLKAHRYKSTYDEGKSSPETWFNFVMFSCVKDKLRTDYRENKNKKQYLESLDESDVVEFDWHKTLLGDVDMTLLDLFYVKEYSINEISKSTGMNVSNITTRLNRLRGKIKKLNDEGNL